MDHSSLNIPIYLNQKVVFDMLASIEDGFSQFSTIQTSVERKTTSSGDASAEIGSSNVFALLGIKLKGSLKGEEAEKDSEMLSQQRVHTPSSLFQKLRSYLYQENLVRHLLNADMLKDLHPGDFIEIKGELSKNPLVSAIDSLIEVMELVTGFTETESSNQKKGHNRAQSNDKKTIEQIKAFSNGLQTESIVDLICRIEYEQSIVNCVLPVYHEYFFNRNMNELTDGSYKIFGKITKSIPNSGESINLLRNTSFSLIKESVLDSMFAHFQSEDVQSSGIDLPDISTKINGPAIMVLPIAIFV